MASSKKPFPEIDDSPPLENLIGQSESMKRVFQLTRIAANSHVPVLLSGEIGTGKNQIAKAIHQLGHRANSPLLSINCGSESAEVIESLIFGGNHSQQNHLELADGGTLLLDEVNRLSDTAQLRLLLVLLEGKFQRPGDTTQNEIDVRIVASSTTNLANEVAEGRFREDLYWCLNVFPIDLPPLRRRQEDIESLIKFYLSNYSNGTGKKISKLQPDALQALIDYPFPGNIRELQNYVLRAIVLATDNVLSIDHLPIAVTGGVKQAQVAVFRPTDDESLLREFVYSQLSKAEPDQEDLYERIVGPLEKELLLQILDACNQTQTKAAKRLGINRNTLYKKLVDFGLVKPKNESNE